MTKMNQQHRVCYGFSRNALGQLVKNSHAYIVEQIFSQYLSGESLRAIIKWLKENQIVSPSGKEAWTPKAIDNLLTNDAYADEIIPLKQFVEVQKAKQRRSNLIKTENGIARKATRYHSQNVLSGLLVCAECGCSYRRITKHDGSILWRCASRVEHGKELCRHSATLTEKEILQYLSGILGEGYTEQEIRSRVDMITVHTDGSFSPKFKQSEQAFGISN